MNDLSVNDALDAMGSDNKLWNLAETKDLGEGRVQKLLGLPWGIGLVTVTLEGMNNASGARNAFSAYGDYIRGIIKEAIDDEAVTARARQAAAHIEQDNRGDSVAVSKQARVRQQAVQEAALQEAEEAHGYFIAPHGGFREALVAQRAAIEDRISWETETVAAAQRELASLGRELKAITAAIAALEEADEPE